MKDLTPYFFDPLFFLIMKDLTPCFFWVLDVTFREDESRIRTGYAPENFNIFRQLGINMLKKEPSKMSIKKKRFEAALNDKFRENVVFLA